MHSPLRSAFVAAAALTGTIIVAHAQAPAKPSGDDQQNDKFRFRTRRRADQRQRDGHRRVGPLRDGPAAGRLRGVRGRAAADHHPLQRRTRAGEPRHRARHERQHGRREVPARAGSARSASSTTCSIRRTRFSSTASATTRCSSRRGRRTAIGSRARCGRIVPRRRHGDVRHGGRGDSAGAAGAEPQEGARSMISDGNDTQPRPTSRKSSSSIRETEVLVYAIGIDGQARTTIAGWTSRPPAQLPCAVPGARSRGRRPTPPSVRGRPGGARRLAPTTIASMSPRCAT